MLYEGITTRKVAILFYFELKIASVFPPLFTIQTSNLGGILIFEGFVVENDRSKLILPISAVACRMDL